MTLVGCLTALDVPILLGDFLVSDEDGSPVGGRKKIRRITSNVAVGYAGALISAETALAWLGEHLSGQAKKHEVEEALLGIDPTDCPRPVTLVGWVVDDGANAFHWQSTNPEMVNWGGPWYIGSGGELLDHQVRHGFVGEEGAEGDDPRTSALELITQLMADEALDRVLRQLAIGHAYEVMWWNNDTFEYIDNIHYIAMRTSYDAEGKVVGTAVVDRHFKYLTRDELSVILKREGEGLHIYIHTPLGLRTPGKTDEAACRALAKELESKTWLDVPADFYGLIFDIEAPGYAGGSPISVIPRDSESKLVKIEETREATGIAIADAALRWMFEQLQASGSS